MDGLQKYLFHVSGMHCKACVLLIEDELQALPDISSVKVNLSEQQLEVSGDFTNLSVAEIEEKISRRNPRQSK